MANTVRFNVHSVEPVNPNTIKKIQTQKIKLQDLAGKRLSTEKVDHVIEAVSDTKSDFYNYNTHGFFKAVHDAYDNHIGLEIHPDHIKLMILQGFAMHVNENAEKFRSLFVSHEGKKKIVVRRDDFVKGGQNPWPELFGEFADKIRSDVKDPQLVNLVQSSFQTTTPTTMAAFNISLMEIVQKYYSYGMMTMCGIPFITLKGSVDDWTSLNDLVNYIEQFELSWWTDKLKPILAEFVKTASGYEPNIDIEFWGNILKINGGSGGPFYDGWLINFFPYLVQGSGMVKNKFKKTTFCFPSGLSSVPVEWNYFGQIFNMHFTSGFFGYTVTDDSICPEISWAVHEHGQVTEKDLIDPMIKNTFKNGKYYNPANLHYNSGIVNCDYCKAKDISQCIGLGDVDLCMKCVDALSVLMK